MTDDTISRRAAIEAVSKGCEEFRGIFEKCEDNISSLPSAPRWIPVTKRLPERDTDVLVTGENGELDIARWNYDSWTEEDAVVWEGSGYSYITPIAWMPLPDPWEGEEDG